MSGPDALSRFLIREAARSTGEFNGCVLMLGRWYDALKSEWPPTSFLTRPDGHDVGLYRGMVRGCAETGIPVSAEPRRGDIGLFRAGNAMMAGIFTGSAWASRTPNGLGLFKQFNTVKAWRI